MIVRSRENWVRMLFIWHGSVLPQILPRLLFFGVNSLAVYYYRDFLFSYRISLNPASFTLLGVALAIFLGFYNATAYDRYWEGRRLWGAVVVDCRDVVRQVINFVKDDGHPEQKKKFVRLPIMFAYALKHQLRLTDATEDTARLLPPDIAEKVNGGKYLPVLILREMGECLNEWERNGKLDSITKMGMSETLNSLSRSVGGCERIANTPIPFPYHVLFHRMVYFYCFLLPFGLVDSLGWITPFVVTFVSYIYIALDAIIEQINAPFGTEPNDLALNDICFTIEESLREMIGDTLPLKQQSHTTRVID